MLKNVKPAGNSRRLDTERERESGYQGNVTIVPRIVINQCCSVAHAGDLIAVIPPRHHTSFVIRILTQPVVRLTKVVQNITRSVEAKHR